MRRLRRLALLAAAPWLLVAAPRAAPAATRVADISRGTNIALALSPDERTLVLSLLGGLWRLPINGGAATQLTPTGQGADNPRFAPNGRQLVYQRGEAGQSDLWLLDLKTGVQHRLTDTPYDEREPDFTPDGRSLVFSSNRTGRYQLWSVDLAAGATRLLTTADGDAVYPAVSSRGDIAYVRREDGQWSLQLRSTAGDSRQLYASSHALSAPSWRPGGHVLVFDERKDHESSRLELLVLSAEPIVKQLTAQEDVFAKRVAWGSRAYFLYTADGRIWRRGIGAHERTPIPFFAGVGIDALRPPTVAAALDGSGPYPVAGIGGWAAAAGGKRYAFTALGDLWLRDGNKTRRLTNDTYVERDPAFFPDGRTIAFATDRGGHMDLWSIDADTDAARPLTHANGKAFAPAVDAQGHRIAYLATTGFGPWAASSLKLLDLMQGGPSRSIAAELIDAGPPHWVDIGGRARLAVEARAAPDAARRWIVFDLQGRRVDAVPAGWTPPPARGSVPPALRRLALQWTPAKTDGDYVVQVGRLFDGAHTRYLRNMDIHVHGQRIVAVVPRGTRPLPGKVIDARNATIIPGLIDVQARQSSLAGRRLGRSWLAYGVTTVREVAGDLPEAVERGEAWSSGRRLGPRLVVTPRRGWHGDDNMPHRPGARSPVVVLNSAQLVDGFGRRVQRDPEAIDAAQRALPNTIPDPGAASPATWLRLSPLGRSYDDNRQTLLASGAIVASTLGATAGPSPSLVPGAETDAGAVLRQLFSGTELQRWRSADADGGAGEPPIQPLRQFLVELIRQGGHVAIGSDAPAVPYGYGVLHEMQSLADAGLPKDQVLRLATAEGAIALGLGRQLGTLEAGKLADFVVLDGDPLADIDATQRVTAVVKGGVWMSRSELLSRH